MNTKKVADLPMVSIDDLDELERQATLEAVEVRHNAYVPITGFKVGAALITVDDNIYAGVNVENHILDVTHAEVNACNTMITAGERQFKVLICVCKGNGVPCGACLQLTREWTGPDLLNKVTVIGVNAHDTSKVIRCTFAEAMAVIDAFGPEHLNINPLEH